MPLSKTEENHGSNDDAHEYNKEEGFVHMWNGSLHGLTGGRLGEELG